MPWYTRVIGIGVNLTVAGALVAWARRSPPARQGDRGAPSARRAALLGAAGGVLPRDRDLAVARRP